MRSARVELGSGGGSSGKTRYSRHSWSGPRPIFLHHERQRTTATQIPGEKFESVSIKNAPVATSKRSNCEHQTKRKHRLPQARCFQLPAPVSPACCSRGQVTQLLRQFVQAKSN